MLFSFFGGQIHWIAGDGRGGKVGGRGERGWGTTFAERQAWLARNIERGCVMNKDSVTKSVVSASGNLSVPIGDPRAMAQQRERCMAAAATPLSWVRYADSRLKQFCCR